MNTDAIECKVFFMKAPKLATLHNCMLHLSSAGYLIEDIRAGYKMFVNETI